MLSIVRRIAFCVLAVLILATTPYAFSQSNNASIDGEITDPNGAVVPGANVVLTSKDTKETSTFVSDPDGLYSFRNVVPGTYQLKVTAQGFGEYLQDGILVRVGYPIRQRGCQSQGPRSASKGTDPELLPSRRCGRDLVRRVND